MDGKPSRGHHPSMRAMAMVFLAMVAMVGCGDNVAQMDQVSVAGIWSYDWQVREDGGEFPGWDGHFRGQMTLTQVGPDVKGTLGYPAEDPATMYGDPTLQARWRWDLAGAFVDGELHLFAPDNGWTWHLTTDGGAMSGPGWEDPDNMSKWPFAATLN